MKFSILYRFLREEAPEILKSLLVKEIEQGSAFEDVAADPEGIVITGYDALKYGNN